MTTPAEVVARIDALALTHPAHGCHRIDALLALGGRRVSAITIQKVLNDKGPDTRHERWLALERQNGERVIELSPVQVAFPEKLDPCVKQRHVESERRATSSPPPPSLGGPEVRRRLRRTDRQLGRRRSARSRASAGSTCTRLVDTFGSCAFDVLHVSKQRQAAVAMLHNGILPLYATLYLRLRAVLPDNGWKLCGTARHP